MTGNSSHTRKPYDPTPYSALRGSDGATLDPNASTRLGSASETVTNDFDSEAEKLRQLREALWAAFEAGPSAGLPNTLIDLTMAYTGALRLQLNLKSISARLLTPQHKTAMKATVKGT